MLTSKNSGRDAIKWWNFYRKFVGQTNLENVKSFDWNRDEICFTMYLNNRIFDHRNKYYCILQKTVLDLAAYMILFKIRYRMYEK